MLSELKFVQGAVAKKDFVPALTHFVIENGTVRGFNGVLALCSPLPLDIECKPKAGPLIQAISNCKDTVSLSLTPGGKLSIKSGKFRALVECEQGDFPHAMPDGERIDFDGAVLMNILKVLESFIGNDAARPWTNGILLSGHSAFATNNVIVCEYWTGIPFPCVVNLPRAAVKEMLRIGEAPTHAQVVKDNNITFHYGENRWMRTQLYNSEWPDLSKILDKPSNPLPMDETLFEGLQTIKPFADKMGDVYFENGTIRTHLDPNEGGSYDVESLQVDGRYTIDMLLKLEGVAHKIDFSTYPAPALFFGDRLRGAIIGLKK